MPERPLTVATYAAGASLAAITLVYIFGPTFFLDEHSVGSRKQGVVGLSNPANDCFINSVLQALAGLGDLRVYLIQELHRRNSDASEPYVAARLDKSGNEYTPAQLRKEQSLLDAVITQALKLMLDRLNERPLFAKTISAAPFIYSLEQAFNTRLNRQQQDAQELLQLVLERLDDEYKAGARLRRSRDADEVETGELEKAGCPEPPPVEQPSSFPFEGRTETIIECQTCHFRPKSNLSTFMTLTLNVPKASNTTLDACFDGLTKQEIIDDYRCDRCRLVHAISVKTAASSRAASEVEQKSLLNDIASLQEALDSDPEKPPPDVVLPDGKTVPRRRVTKHTRISHYPKTLAIHLSRSIFDPGSYLQKNTSKVSFPEHLKLSNLGDGGKDGTSVCHRYRLLSLVTHHGGHNSGHYETFRRQIIDTPGQRPKSLDPERTGSTPSSPSPSPPQLAQSKMPDRTASNATTDTSRLQEQNLIRKSSSSTAPERQSTTTTTPAAPRTSLSLAREQGRLRERARAEALRRRRKEADKWWRMSDDKVRECRTGAVLGMQRDAYLLFYELDE